MTKTTIKLKTTIVFKRLLSSRYLYTVYYINKLNKNFKDNNNIVGVVVTSMLLEKENLSELNIPKLIIAKTKYSPDLPIQPYSMEFSKVVLKL